MASDKRSKNKEKKMSTFEVELKGSIYEIDAENEEDAAKKASSISDMLPDETLVSSAPTEKPMQTTTERLMTSPNLDLESKAQTSLFPRAMAAAVEGKSGFKQLGQGALDVLSLPMREITAAAAQLTGKDKGAEQYFQRQARYGAEENASLPEKIITAPENLVMGGAGKVGVTALKKAVPWAARTVGFAPKVAQMAAEGAGAGIGADVTQKADRATGEGLGSIKEEAAASALNIGGGAATGAAMPVIGKTVTGSVRGLGKGMQDVAKLGQGKSWKLTGTPEQVAAKREVAATNNIWGDARKATEQTTELITEKYNILKGKISEASEKSGTTIDPVALLDEAEASAINAAAPEKKKAVKKIFEDIKEDAANRFKGKEIDLADAQIYKQQLGEWGDDAFDVTKKGKAVSAQGADHQAYVNAYDKFKVAIEKKGPEGIKEANQELSKLLDLRKDVRKRVAVEERNKFIPLDEVVTGAAAAFGAAHGNLIPAAMLGVQAASRNPASLKGLYGLGKGLESMGKKKIVTPNYVKENPSAVELPAGAETVPAYRRLGINPEENAAKIERRVWRENAPMREDKPPMTMQEYTAQNANTYIDPAYRKKKLFGNESGQIGAYLKRKNKK
jgi:hypothetical protein